jgi:hypothetical protein
VPRTFFYSCPNTGYRVQGHVEEQCESSDAYEAVTYPICRQVHLVNPDAERDDERQNPRCASYPMTSATF